MVDVLRDVLARIRWRMSLGRTARTLIVVIAIIYGGALLFRWTQHVSFFTALLLDHHNGNHGRLR